MLLPVSYHDHCLTTISVVSPTRPLSLDSVSTLSQPLSECESLLFQVLKSPHTPLMEFHRSEFLFRSYLDDSVSTCSSQTNGCPEVWNPRTPFRTSNSKIDRKRRTIPTETVSMRGLRSPTYRNTNFRDESVSKHHTGVSPTKDGVKEVGILFLSFRRKSPSNSIMSHKFRV